MKEPLLHKIIRKLYYLGSVARRESTSISDNQAYPQVCLNASQHYRYFNKFKRNPIYNHVLENLSRELGQQYLDIIRRDPDIANKLNIFSGNDQYGGPRKYRYGSDGAFSPTTLRYVKVLSDLKKYYETLDNLQICEIGVGYGGQCNIINMYFNPTSYCLVDITPALTLAQRFLDNFITPATLTYKTLNELERRAYDLIISNYAFTELRRPVQEAYLEKIILPARRGYITFNDTNPGDFNSFTLDELLHIIPGSQVHDEEPLTHPKNCIIAWGRAVHH